MSSFRSIRLSETFAFPDMYVTILIIVSLLSNINCHITDQQISECINTDFDLIQILNVSDYWYKRVVETSYFSWIDDCSIFRTYNKNLDVDFNISYPVVRVIELSEVIINHEKKPPVWVASKYWVQTTRNGYGEIILDQDKTCPPIFPTGTPTDLEIFSSYFSIVDSDMKTWFAVRLCKMYNRRQFSYEVYTNQDVDDDILRGIISGKQGSFVTHNYSECFTEFNQCLAENKTTYVSPNIFNLLIYVLILHLY